MDVVRNRTRRNMAPLLDSLLKRLTASAQQDRRRRSFQCRCERPVFFRNSQCLACNAELGYVPEIAAVRTLEPADTAGTWKLDGEDDPTRTYRRCANFDNVAGCNWLLDAGDTNPLCRSCRLNRTVADMADADNQRYWRAIENDKRLLVSQLLALELPVLSKVSEDPARGVAFDLLRSPPDGPRVLTGHASGLITLNVEEADDSKREKIRHDLREPYRTLLGHFRHEIGHYFWDRLIYETKWHGPFRELFGDEQTDYAAALKSNYENGPPADWAARHISSYASTHPWEDWAETWAHYLHVVDGLDTALSFGLTAEDTNLEVERYKKADLYAPDDEDAKSTLSLLNGWLELTMVLNELARSMGQHDFYPFVMSRPVVKKLHFIELVIKDAQRAAQVQRSAPSR